MSLKNAFASVVAAAALTVNPAEAAFHSAPAEPTLLQKVEHVATEHGGAGIVLAVGAVAAGVAASRKSKGPNADLG